MSYVAFDLDNTLGYFYHVTPIAYFLSAETLENRSYMHRNATFKLSPSLKAKMAAAEAAYTKKLLERPHLLNVILRPNLDALIRPVLQGRQTGRVRGVLIYSNTDNTFSMRLAVNLIEAKYNVKGLFCAAVDATHPIRRPDFERMEDDEPLKTYKVLRNIIRTLCRPTVPIQPSNIIFVDERPKRHALTNYEPEGLAYIQPSVYAPKIPRAHKKEIFTLLLEVLEEQGLLADPEYMDSSIFHCFRRKYVNGYSTRRCTPIAGFHELAHHAAHEIATAGNTAVPFKNDTIALRRAMLRALARH